MRNASIHMRAIKKRRIYSEKVVILWAGENQENTVVTIIVRRASPVLGTLCDCELIGAEAWLTEVKDDLHHEQTAIIR